MGVLHYQENHRRDAMPTITEKILSDHCGTQVEPGDFIEFEIGFKRSEIGSIENMDKLIYNHEEQWGTIHQIYKEVDI